MSDFPIPEGLPDQVLIRLRERIPTLEAVLLAGSFARDAGSPFSDLDLLALSADEPEVEDLCWFEPLANGRLMHISVAWEQLRTPAEPEPADWSLGFAVRDVQRYLWATERARALLGSDPGILMPPAPPALEDFVELFLKAKRAAAEDDKLLLRWAARLLAEHAPPLLLEFNPERIVHTPAEALAAALALPNVPDHFYADFSRCYGLEPVAHLELLDASGRLVRELLAFLRMRADAGTSRGIYAYLCDGTLEKYIQDEKG